MIIMQSSRMQDWRNRYDIDYDGLKRDGYDVRVRLIEMTKRQLEVHSTADNVSGLPVEHDDGGPGAATASILRLS
jgi:hypothetical protein